MQALLGEASGDFRIIFILSKIANNSESYEEIKIYYRVNHSGLTFLLMFGI